MQAYADTNFLTRLYIRRLESDQAELLVRDARAEGLTHLPITWLLYMETVNAFEQYVFLSRTVGTVRVTTEQASIAQHGFKQDLQCGQFLLDTPVAVGELASRCDEFSRRHTARHGFRIYDLIHVASALLLGCKYFWSFDQRARKLAKLEGLGVNPAAD